MRKETRKAMRAVTPVRNALVRLAWAGVSLAAATGWAQAQSPVPAEETPLSVFTDAVSINPGLRAAQAARDAEHEGEAIARAGLMPSASMSGFLGQAQTDRAVTSLPLESFLYTTNQYSLNFRVPIYHPVERANFEQAGKKSEAADEQFRSARNTLVIQTLTAYFDAAYGSNLVNLLRAQHASVREQLNAAGQAYKLGVGTRIEISDARSQLDLIEAQELDALNQQDHALRTLQSYVGRPVGRIDVLSPAKFVIGLPRPLDLNGWIEAAIAGSSDLAAARAQAEVARREISKASANHLPTVDVVASRSLSGNSNMDELTSLGDVRYRQNMVGVQVNVPLYSGGGISATERQAALRYSQAQLQVDDVRQKLEVGVRQDYGNVTQGAEKIRAYEQAEISANVKLEATRKGVEGGERTNLDVLDAETKLYSTRRDLYLARYQLLISWLRLLSYTGQLVDADIARMSAWFGPADEVAAPAR
jgi:protease secretion system outer membrane protein